jgi:flagellar basal-body rod protein FlgG
MLRGIYTAASAMGMQMDAVGVFAHNLANAGTTGYKRSELMSQSFPNMVIQMANGSTSPLGLGVGTEAALLDQSQGALKNTGNPMDVAIEGDGYFTVRKPNGLPDITRDGGFGLDPNKRLITHNGDLVIGQNGQPIQFIDGLAEQIRFQPDGTITEAGQQIGKLALVQGKPSSAGLAPSLQRYITTVENGGAIRAPQVRQGFLEEANVSIVKEMVALLGSQKNYDVGQKLIQASDKMLDKVINEMGR